MLTLPALTPSPTLTKRDLALDISAWLLTEGKGLGDLRALVDSLCERLNQAGVPLDRAIASTRTLHAVHLSYFRLWRREGESVYDTYDRDEEGLGYFDRSPMRAAMESGEWVELWLAETPDDAYNLVPDLKAGGFTHYICAPIIFADGTRNSVSWATKHPEGFSAAHRATLKTIEFAFGAVLEIGMLRRAMVETLQTYLGNEPGRRVAQGSIVRGDVTRIEAAILFADLRGFMANSMHVASELLVRMLNEYYECVIAAVERHGGDVLKLIGDGMLAIFPDEDGGAAERAMQAAEEAQSAIGAANARGSDWPELVMGIALHHGAAAYGNIGSTQRLDFTVVGRDVNIASRISTACREAGAPLLMSAAFKKKLGRPGVTMGAFPMHGLDEPMTLYAPGVLPM